MEVKVWAQTEQMTGAMVTFAIKMLRKTERQGGLRGEDNTGVHLVEKDGDFKMMKPFLDLNNTTPLYS